MINDIYYAAAVLQLVATGYGVWMALTAQRKRAWVVLTLTMGLMLWSRIARATYLGTSFTALSMINSLLISAMLVVTMVMVRRLYLEGRSHEEKLEESEERYRAVVRALGEGIVIIDRTGVSACNPAAEGILGKTQEAMRKDASPWVGCEVIGHSGTSLDVGELPGVRTLATGEEAREVSVGLRQSSGEVWLRVTARPLFREEEAKPYAVLVSMLDVTERRASRAALVKAKEFAEHANQAKDQFLAVLSHELRTPLTPVLATIELMGRNPRTASVLGEEIELLRRNVELEARLIDDLLDLTRVSKGALQLNLEVVDTHEVVKHVLEICRGDAAAKGLTVSAELKAERRHVRGDPARLRQVVWNLLKNAIKFTPAGGAIVVRTTSAGALTIVVEDNGSGIEPAVMERLFVAFEQGDPRTARQFGGLGLGLAITKALVEMHGGTIGAASAGKGAGARFEVELPVVEARREDVAPALREGEEVRGLRILLVEDHVDTCRTMTRLLTRVGHLVESAGTVEGAMKMASGREFDLVISDIGLPDGTGLDFLREFRRTKGTPAIALSGFGMDDDVRRSKEAGFFMHLSKPVNFEKLQGAIEEAVGRG